MSLVRSEELIEVLAQGHDIAKQTRQTMTSAHVLLAIFTVTNPASLFLKERGITVDGLLAAMKNPRPEAPEIMRKIAERSLRIALSARADSISSLHYLAALVREKSSQAWILLDETGVDIGAIRASIMSYATDSRPRPQRVRHFELGDNRRPARVEQTPYQNEPPPSPIEFHPSLGVRAGRAHSILRRENVFENEAVLESKRQAIIAPQVISDTTEAWEEEFDDFLSRESRYQSRTLIKTPIVALSPAEPVQKPSDEAVEEARLTARKLAENLFAKRKEAERQAKLRTTAERAARLEKSKAKEEKPEEKPPEVSKKQSDEGRLAARLLGKKSVKAAKPLEVVEKGLEPDIELAAAYELDEEQYPFLVKFGRNLTAEAALLQVDSAIGRDSEIGQLIDILGKRRSNNPLLVGPPGVGKTAIVEGLACEFVEMARRKSPLGRRVIVELEMGRLLSGTHLRGSFSERLIGIKEEVKRAKGQVIIFLDEVHTWISAGAGGDGGDAAGELKTALARGQFPCIGATTNDEYRKFIETDSAFERRFQSVQVEEPDEETAIKIMRGVAPHYEKHHGVLFADEAVEASVRLGNRYIHERQLPDKAISVLDLAGSRAARVGKAEVGREDVARVVAEIAGIPADRLLQQDRERFLQMESVLAKGIVGHAAISATIADVIRRNYAGFRSRRPIGSLLFLGPTGVGKTEMVKVLADFLFHDRDAIVRMDMSEFMESHSVSRMIGSPPGYVGHDQGGQLTEAIRRRPYQVVLLDEIEKAHPDVLNLLLQVFDEGRLTDGRGRQVDFANTVIVMTSNLGASALTDDGPKMSRGRIGFGDAGVGFGATIRDQKDAANEKLKEDVLTAARAHFTPELWNRIDERLVFLPLERAEVAQIAFLQLADSSRRLKAESEIELTYDDAVVEFLIENGGYDPKLGARPMRQTIQRLVEGAVARLLLQGGVRRGSVLRVCVEGSGLVVSVG